MCIKKRFSSKHEPYTVGTGISPHLLCKALRAQQYVVVLPTASSHCYDKNPGRSYANMLPHHLITSLLDHINHIFYIKCSRFVKQGSSSNDIFISKRIISSVEWKKCKADVNRPLWSVLMIQHSETVLDDEAFSKHTIQHLLCNVRLHKPTRILVFA